MELQTAFFPALPPGAPKKDSEQPQTVKPVEAPQESGEEIEKTNEEAVKPAWGVKVDWAEEMKKPPVPVEPRLPPSTDFLLPAEKTPPPTKTAQVPSTSAPKVDNR